MALALVLVLVLVLGVGHVPRWGHRRHRRSISFHASQLIKVHPNPHILVMKDEVIALEGYEHVNLDAGHINFQNTPVKLEYCPETAIDAEIEKAFLEFHTLGNHNGIKLETPDSLSPEEHQWTTPEAPSFECFDETSHHVLSSVTSEEMDVTAKQHQQQQNLPSKQQSEMNCDTVALLKQELANHSRLVGTYTTMKSAYLKLCSEFNYLLGKFNDNERIKLNLIHENNELRQLLVDVIKEKELDRRRYKEELLGAGMGQA